MDIGISGDSGQLIITLADDDDETIKLISGSLSNYDSPNSLKEARLEFMANIHNATIIFHYIKFYPTFNPNINIEITSNDLKSIELDIINVRGEQVSQLFSGNIYAGKTNFSWNANTTLPSGIYLIRLENSNIISTKKILLIK